jgi:hypothetical protein
MQTEYLASTVNLRCRQACMCAILCVSCDQTRRVRRSPLLALRVAAGVQLSLRLTASFSTPFSPQSLPALFRAHAYACPDAHESHLPHVSPAFSDFQYFVSRRFELALYTSYHLHSPNPLRSGFSHKHDPRVQCYSSLPVPDQTRDNARKRQSCYTEVEMWRSALRNTGEA